MRVIDYVHDHPAEDLNLDRLARVAALSRYHFHRVFRGITGETLAHMVRRVRMERAATLLTFDTLPIAEVAETAGYPNVPSFTRAFSEIYGLPPGAYRERGTHRPQLLNLRKGANEMTRPVEIRTEPARRLAGVLHRGPYQAVGQAMNQLFGSYCAAFELASVASTGTPFRCQIWVGVGSRSFCSHSTTTFAQPFLAAMVGWILSLSRGIPG